MNRFKRFFIVTILFLMSSASVLMASSDKAGEHGVTEDHGNPLIHHLTDSSVFVFDKVHLGSLELDFSFTKHFLLFWLAGLIIFIVLAIFYDKKKTVQTGFIANVIEKFVLFIREDIVKPNISHGYDKMMPFFLTIFALIFTANYLGMIPYSASSTGNLSVTTGLALISFFTTQIMGVKENGLVGHFKGLMPGGIPAFVIPILLPVEIIGMFTKPFALAVRLFANMTAGHAIILSFLLIGWTGGEVQEWNFWVSIGTVPAAIFIGLLEVLVCFLQAYVFTLLSAIFIGASMHPEH